MIVNVLIFQYLKFSLFYESGVLIMSSSMYFGFAVKWNNVRGLKLAQVGWNILQKILLLRSFLISTVHILLNVYITISLIA